MSLRRELPRDLSFWGLFGPQNDYDYFAGGERFPFLPQAAGYRAVNAWWMADAAMLAYVVDRRLAESRLRAAGFHRVHFFVHGSTHAVLAERDDALLLVFRGTDDYLDVLTDLAVARTPAEGPFLVHTGFRNALDQVWPELQAVVADRRGGRPLWITGHSLGAALATLAARRLKEVSGLYTFGSPRVGDRRFAATYPLPNWRFRNNDDFVTTLPWPLLYRHTKELRYIDARGAIHEQVDFWKRMKDSLFGARARIRAALAQWKEGNRDALPVSGIVDHAPILYATRIRNRVVDEAANESTGSRKGQA